MKQIKLLLLIVSFSFFGAVNAQTIIEEVTTYRWNGSINTLWDEPGNWTIVNSNLAPIDRSDFPNVVPQTVPPEIPGDPNQIFTQVHNVIIPAGLTNYPTLNTDPTKPIINSINITDLVLESGATPATPATLSLVGKTLVISGTLSGGGQLIGSLTSDLAFDGKDKINIISKAQTQAEVDALFPALPASYFNNFNNIVIDGLGAIVTGYTSTISNRTLSATSPDGTVFFINTPGGNKQMSTVADFEPITFTFDQAQPVYSFSANVSVTAEDFTPMTLGRFVPFNGAATAGPNDYVVINEVQVTVTLVGGATFDYFGDASGDLIGFTTQIPIQSVEVNSHVMLFDNLIAEGRGPVGFVTVDDVKFGGRLPVGTLNMSQATNSTKSLQTLSVNVVDATTGINNVILDNSSGLTLGNSINIYDNIYPQSGVINSSPAVGDRNLTLISRAIATASVRNHTTTGSINGTVNVQRFITNFDDALQEARKKQWRFLGFPYSNTLRVGDITGINVSYATPTLMEFREFQANDALGNGNVRNNGYSTFSTDNGQLGTLSGLAAWIYEEPNPTTGDLTAPKTLSSFGSLYENGANVTKNLFYTDRNVVDQGWNLISNPFASTIDWSSPAITKTAIEGTIYRWDPQAGNWTALNGLTATPAFSADQYIESGSSFFVKATAVGANIVFGQNAKVLATTSVLNQFRKNGTKLDLAQQAAGSTPAKAKTAGIRINASGPGNPIPSQAYLDLSQAETSEGFDAQFDARNMGRTSGANVAIQGAEQLDMTMQYDRPIAEAGKEKRYYPLKVSVPSAGKTKIELELEGNWNSLNTVYLIDKKEGKTTPLSGGKLSYEFNMVNTVENDRFTLAINHINVGNKSGIVSTDLRVMNNPVRSDVIDAIIAHPSAKAKSYSIVNGSGATLNKGSIQDNNSVQHQLGFGKSNANGVMYLRVDFENGDSKTVKFIKL